MFTAEFKTGAVPLLGIGTFVIWTVVVGIGLSVSTDTPRPCAALRRHLPTAWGGLQGGLGASSDTQDSV